jgi:hypothetical protein
MLCRLAVLFRRRPSEVAAWPAWEVRLLEQYLAKQPAAEDRIEIAVARLTATYVNAHLREGTKAVETTDYLAYHDPWSKEVVADPEYVNANKGWLQAFRSLSSRMRK